MSFLATSTGSALCAFARLLTGARALWTGCAPVLNPRIYFGNHSSHADFILIWASLPTGLRVRTRPVAGADYWQTSRVRRFLIHEVFHGVLVARSATGGAPDPILAMTQVLDAGDSLILFPEGTRNTTDETLLPFKSGLARVALARPNVECVPVWIENLNRVMPKGEFVPLPLLCTLTFGKPLMPHLEESPAAFLSRTRQALLSLAPHREDSP